MFNFLYLATILESGFAMLQNRTRRHGDLLGVTLNTVTTVTEMLQPEMPGETRPIPTYPNGDHQEGLPTVEPHGDIDIPQRGRRIVEQLGTLGLSEILESDLHVLFVFSSSK